MSTKYLRYGFLVFVLLLIVVNFVPPYKVQVSVVESRRVASSLDDPDAPKAIQDLKNQYNNTAIPVYAIFIPLGVAFLFLKVKAPLATKLALIAVIGASTFGFFYVRDTFSEATKTAFETAFPIKDDISAIYQSMPAQEAMFDSASDPELTDGFQKMGAMSESQGKMMAVMGSIMEDTINASTAMSVLFLLVISILTNGIFITVFHSEGGTEMLLSLSKRVWQIFSSRILRRK